MNPRIAILISFLFFYVSALSQQTASGGEEANFAAEKGAFPPIMCRGQINTLSVDRTWRPTLQHRISRNVSNNDVELQAIKAEKNALKFGGQGTVLEEQAPESTADPVLQRNFIGNINNGCPPDNTVAISNSGYIVTMVNANIEYYDQNGLFLYGNDLWSFFSDPTLTNSICDPKVIYDNVADRFLLYAQVCDGVAANSRVILCFSKTGNPLDGWWYYWLTGNPLSDGSWFDYPKVAISNQELFVTGNLYYSAGGYNKSVIYQVMKSDGYSGAALRAIYWYNLTGSPFTLLPVGNGQAGNYGPGIYLVSTSANGASAIKLYQVTADQLSSPSVNYWSVPTAAYSPAGNAAQSGSTNLLHTGDCRMLDGFILNGTIHFVFHSDIGGGWSGINYNRLNVSTRAITTRTFGASGSYDYVFPAVASIGSNSSDPSVMVVFGRSGPSINPQMRVASCDQAMNFSNSVLVRQSLGPITACHDSNFGAQRWGDYSGICRKINAGTPTVWAAGCYGNGLGGWGTWIAEIGQGAVGMDEPDVGAAGLSLFPNPTAEVFSVRFELKKDAELEICLKDLQGKVVADLYAGKAFKGENSFSFNKANLVSGIYFLEIRSQQNVFVHEKLVVQR